MAPMKRSSSETSSSLSSPPQVDSSTSLTVTSHDDQLQEPSAKKTKIVKQSPIMFISPGQAVDTSIIVFNQEFRVSSVGLKANTMYFQKFLDPSNGSTNKKYSSKFKYQWYTKVEADGGWCISSAPEDRVSDMTAYIGDSEREEKAFHNLLRAVFSQQAVIEDATDLCRLTILADFTCCLPVVKNSLFQTLIKNPNLYASIQKTPLELIEWALKLRHPYLFRECLIHLLGPFHNPRYLKVENPTIFSIARVIDQQFRAYLCNVQRDLLGLILEGKASAQFETVWRHHLKGSHVLVASTQTRVIYYPAWFRKLCTIDHANEELNSAVKRILGPVLKNCLTLDGSGAQSGEGRFRDYFLCYDIPDSVMPWNENESDW
ncbi:hypothetical protein GLAREA_08399 [Glarea lozoyensis ATCC 20868]|uniref:BTB domain-containing protein n=1 Tax=Glarea lozoyensis (strain ATCC 20868 / MF5171) TaxID=1116229 RepID=S3CDD6_GLAL2|nr:uncharacterized protein GLAREA_08399 [Glarea lozoyensis ATCC 20868]EPE24547.1 hypothetical protein GLAREA_08399 [Glarea lozoyensis ATCC 20868]